MSSDQKLTKHLRKPDQTEFPGNRSLILHNDNYHSFDYVIDALIEVCSHNEDQATQCTILTHYKGKCEIKKGSFDYLSPMRRALVNKDLKATID